LAALVWVAMRLRVLELAVFQVVMPLLLMLCTWCFTCDRPYSFLRTFGCGDLILLAALLLLGALGSMWFERSNVHTTNRLYANKFDAYFVFTLVLVLATFATFLLIKTTSEQKLQEQEVISIATSIGACLGGAIWSAFIFCSLVNLSGEE
jgi:hypothetical protein